MKLLLVDTTITKELGSCTKSRINLHEVGNSYDYFAIKIWGSVCDNIVEHLLMEISHSTKFLLQHGAVIKVTLLSTNYRKSCLLQEGVGNALSSFSSLPATLSLKNSKIYQCFVWWIRWLWSTGFISSPYDWDSQTFTKKNI